MAVCTETPCATDDGFRRREGHRMGKAATLQVCYVVVSKGWDRHSQMAWVSAHSVRRQEPSARIVMVVDGDSEAAEREMARRFADVADAVIPKRSNEATAVAKSRHHKIVLREY